jgi:N-acetylmuramoyl-L-alanine amidase
MKIWLDAGHGGNDSGASAFGKIEKDWTLDIDTRIAEILSYNNIKHERTRTTDITVTPDIRASRVRNSGADYCISSHINAGGGEGAETIHSIYNETGKNLAQLILDELGEIGLNKRRVFSREGSNGDYYFMHRETGSVTTIIVEYGFIDNENDNNFLSQAGNRQKCAEAVVKGIFKLEGINYMPIENDNEEDNDEDEDNNNNDNNDNEDALQEGDRGERVEELQRNLLSLGYSLDNYGVDGIFGEETKRAVIQFQRDNNILTNGVVGPATQLKIQELLAKISEETIYRVIVDGEQVGAFEVHENILRQVENYLGEANSIIVEKVR